jgi:hypothetical protein
VADYSQQREDVRSGKEATVGASTDWACGLLEG